MMSENDTLTGETKKCRLFFHQHLIKFIAASLMDTGWILLELETAQDDSKLQTFHFVSE
jgi:hypothetical protein